MRITKGRQQKPRRVLFYGMHGVGKSTWASEAPRPLFINLEDGIGDIDCDATPKLNTVGEISDAISWLIGNDHAYQTVVIDTADWFEMMLQKQIAQEFGKKTYEEIEYGKGAGRLIAGWNWLLGSLEVLRGRGMNAVLLAHSRIEKFADPAGVSYDRYVPDLCKTTFGLVQEWPDEVLFARFRTLTTEVKEAFGTKRNIAVGGKERLVLTSESASCVAKNRLRLPDELPMTWVAYQSHWPAGQQQEAEPIIEHVTPAPTGNLDGVIVDGSSKIQA